MPRTTFATIEEIPDTVPRGLLLEDATAEYRVPQEDAHTTITTTPVEVGYILFETPCNLYLYKKRLLHHELQGDTPNDFLNGAWMNHSGRAVVRAALDPDRTAPIDMLKVYKNELRVFGARFPGVDEVDYFRHFVDTFGVLERDQN
jgi:hypothetical protein